MAAIAPTLDEETRLWMRGFLRVAGVDEVGRGALAGPVVAAAVVLPASCALRGVWTEVRDSKQLRAAQRDLLAQRIREEALAWAVGEVPGCEIDVMGIAAATRKAMASALAALDPPADYLLIDWVRLDAVNIQQESFIKADARIVSVAAASILAKVHRDAWMAACDADFAGYGFAANKGYGTAAHLAALRAQGACPLHRYSFAPIRTGLFADCAVEGESVNAVISDQ